MIQSRFSRHTVSASSVLRPSICIRDGPVGRAPETLLRLGRSDVRPLRRTHQAHRTRHDRSRPVVVLVSVTTTNSTATARERAQRQRAGARSLAVAVLFVSRIALALPFLITALSTPARSRRRAGSSFRGEAPPG